MDDSRRQYQELRSTLTRRLHILELQAAKYGIAAPPHVVIEIEDLRKEIAELDRTHAGSTSATGPVSGADPERISKTEQYRRQQLQQRYDALKQEADATHNQIMSSIDEAQRVVLQRKLDGIYQEMGTIESQLP